MKLESTEEYPVKLKKLMKEVQFSREKQIELKERLSYEQDVVAR